MATSLASIAPQAIARGLNSDPSTASMDDPFITNPQQPPQSHRYSTFDSHLFNLNASSSPTQAKRALEAHLAETERRLQETSKLGTNLVNQRAQLSEKLKEVEKQQNEAEIGPELRQKLLDLEKEYNEVGRDSARAFLGPKSKLAISDDVGQSGGQNAGPATFSSQATASPTKVSVPSRTQRNKPSSKIDNIEFATEISTSLLAQVRQLQALLAERDETLKTVSLEKSRLELEAEGFSQRVKALDESEQRYKDENWRLETHTHELRAAAKDSADREKKLVASLGIATTEKQGAQRDLDELKQSHSKLVEDHAAKQKAHDSELHTMRRNLTSSDTERTMLQRKMDELTSQNQELAKAVAARFRHEELDSMHDTGSGPEDLSLIRSSPEHSPPPSPSKGTPRHNHLESETLKRSLHHAHRMMQNLRGNIHREKTEKMELKRMLQEARDELELRRGEPGGPNSGSKRQKTKSQDAFKKPARPGVLGADRNSKTEYEMDEDWEDHLGENSPSQAAASRYLKVDAGNRSGNPTDMSDAYHTANETEDAFETANERETESEAFQTGAESLAGNSSDELTETEQNVDRAGTVRAKKPIPTALTKPGNRSSYLSTASTSAGEEEDELHTPVQTQMPRYRLRVGRGSSRRSKIPDDVIVAGGTPESNKDSPASFTSNRSPPIQGGQSLFAELNDLNGDEDVDFGTPSKSSIYSDRPTPGRTEERVAEDPEHVPIHKTAMVDSTMQTDPMEPSEAGRGGVSSWIAAAGGLLTGGALASHHDQPKSADSEVIDSATQYTPQKGVQAGNLITPPKTTWDESTEKSLSPGQSMPNSHDSENRSAPLTFSPVGVQHTVPVSPKHSRAPPLAPLTLSNIQVQETMPVSPIVPPARSSRRPIVDYSTPVATQTEDADSRPRTAERADAKTGILGSIFGRKGRRGSQPSTAEDETSLTPRADPQTTQESPLPFRDISTNVGPRGMGNTERLVKPVDAPLTANDKFDQGSQTILSSDQIDQILMERNRRPPSSKEPDYVQPVPIVAPATPTRSQRPTSQSRQPEAVTREPLAVQATPKRPGSAGSNRMSTASILPPLPADHRQAIEAARVSSSGTTSSVMGPPLAPASAYRVNSRLSQRSVDQVQSPNSKAGTTPRARPRGSRRSSISSFASELDERFNIRANEYGVPHGFEPGTDPRMIQAITQTMIGEFLWKYTRKAGRPDMSNTRHRRYFWVHPYTRTLYWCDQDPQSAGRNELKAKSVPIEAVRVISDDNPLPPGLHRKSLEITTPGRKIKFTASTSQRHETWFNALSYLLLRTNDPPGPAHTELFSTEDINEFNPRTAYANTTRQSRGTAASLSSYNSRTTRNTSFVRAPSSTSASRQPLNHTVSGASISSEQQQQQQVVPTQPQDTANLRQGSISRLSSMFKQGTIRGSFSSQKSRTSGIHDRGDPSIYDASVVHDSTEDVKPAPPPQDSEGLENVRACCDGTLSHILVSFWVKIVADDEIGKHDVSSLTHRHRSTGGRHSHVPGPSSWTGSRSHQH
jgi:hypothetical protein